MKILIADDTRRMLTELDINTIRKELAEDGIEDDASVLDQVMDELCVIVKNAIAQGI